MKNCLLPAAFAAIFLLPATTRADDDGDDVAVEEPAAAAAGSFSFGKPKAADPANLVTVRATGQGESVDAAKKDAVRNAIKKTVGELVDAKTLVEKDELVEDRILALSNAMVEKADYGEAKSVGDGLFEVPVTAVVKKGRLNRELEKIGIATGSVSGSSLAATLFSGRERVANAEKFFAERLKDFPGNVVEAVMLAKDDGTPNIEIDTDNGHVFANVGIRVNMENYAEWTRQLQEVLDAVCLEQEKTNLKFGPDFCTDIVPVRQPPKPAVPVTVVTPAAEKVRRSTWPATVYWLDEQIWKAFLKALDAQFPEAETVEVVLEDEDGEPVCSKVVGVRITKQLSTSYPWYYGDTIPLNATGAGGQGLEAERTTACIMPAFSSRAEQDWRFGEFEGIKYHRDANLTAKFRIDLGEVSEDDLDAVSDFKVKLEFRKPRSGGDSNSSDVNRQYQF